MTRYPHCVFGLPASARFFFAEDDEAGGGGGGTSDAALVDFDKAKPLTSPQERVEGEKLPDFGQIGKKPAAATVTDPPDPAKPPEKGQKPAGEAPAKPAATPKEPAKPAKPVEKAKEPEKPAKEPVKPVAKPAEPVKPAEKAKEGDGIPENDDDLEALKPKPGVPTHVVKSFDDMRGLIKKERTAARAALAELTKAKGEIETLKTASGQLPEEVTKELEGLRKLSLVTQVENSPVFKQEFDAKFAKAEGSIYGLLEKHGLNKKVIDEIKAVAAKAGGDIEAWPRLGELVDTLKNPVDKQELLQALKARRDIAGERSARLAELGQSRESFMAAYGKREQEEQTSFAQGVEKASIPLAAANEWILERAIPDGADKAQKEAIEAENAAVKARADQFGNHVRDIYARDPEKAAEIALRAVEAEVLREQVTTLTTERDKASARVVELEKQLAKIRGAGRIAHVEAPSSDSTKTTTTTEEGKVGGDGHQAIGKWFAEKRR